MTQDAVGLAQAPIFRRTRVLAYPGRWQETQAAWGERSSSDFQLVAFSIEWALSGYVARAVAQLGKGAVRMHLRTITMACPQARGASTASG